MSSDLETIRIGYVPGTVQLPSFNILTLPYTIISVVQHGQLPVLRAPDYLLAANNDLPF